MDYYHDITELFLVENGVEHHNPITLLYGEYIAPYTTRQHWQSLTVMAGSIHDKTTLAKSNSDGCQYHQYQQNEQFPLISTEFTEHVKVSYNITELVIKGWKRRFSKFYGY